MPQIFTFTVSDPEGMHARPAGRLVAKAQMNRASPLPTVENPWMPSISVLWDLMFNKVTRLRFGCRATMKLSLLQSSSDSSRSTCNENDTGRQRIRWHCYRHGPRARRHPTCPVERRLIDDPQAEMDRFRAARDTAVAQLKQLRDNVAAEFGENKAELFDAHRLMLRTRTMRNASKV